MIERVVFVLGLFAGCSISANAYAAPSCATGEIPQPNVKLGPLSVDRCYKPYDAAEKAAFKDISSYYGRVEMDVSAGVNMELDKSFGATLATLFGVKDKFTAVVTVAVYARIADEEVLVYEMPIYTITREKNEKVVLSADILGGDGIAVSPTFALDASNAQVRTKLKIALVNLRKLDALPVIKEGVDIATKMGGPTSLVTAVGEPAFLAVASRIQSTYEAALSDQETGNLDTILKFDRRNGNKSVKYRVQFPVPRGQASNVDIRLTLSTTETLITDAQPRKDAANVEWPNVAGLDGKRYADRIKLATRIGPGQTLTTLSTALDQQGVPQKLEELSVAGNASEQLSRQDAVNKNCRALQSALQKGPYRLNDADAQLVLFNELELGGVFDRYDASILPCTRDLVAPWKARYNLSPKSPTPTRAIPWKSKEARLNRMAKSWDLATPDVRTFALGEDFATANIPIVAPIDFIPNVPVVEGPPGFKTFDVGVQFLAERKKRCFGNFKPNADNQPWATAFAQFENDPASYLLTLRFDNRSEFLFSPGPRVSAIEIRPASVSDRSEFNQSSNCL